MEESIDKQRILDYWIESSDKDFKKYDDYKQSFYLLCNDSFTTEWIEKIKDCRSWIKTML